MSRKRKWETLPSFPLDRYSGPSGSKISFDPDSFDSNVGTLLDTKLDWCEKVKNEVSSLFEIIKNADLRTTDPTEPLSRLLLIWWQLRNLGKDDAAKMGDYMVTLEFIQVLTKFFERGIQRALTSNFLLKENVLRFMDLILNLTDTSKKVCESVVSNDLHTKLLETLRALFEKRLRMRPHEQNVAVTSFSILYNTLRNFPDSKTKFRKAGVLGICSKFLSTEQPRIKILALLVLTFAVDLDEAEKIVRASESNLRFLILSLKKTLGSPDNENEEGFNLEELLESMSRLAMNKTNALEMVKLKVLQHCLSVLTGKKYSVTEVKWTLKLIWSLSFADENHGAIISSGIVPLVKKKLEEHKNQEFSEPAEGILWELKVKKPDVTPNSNTKRDQSAKRAKKKGHIMISYCWRKEGEKKKAHQIYGELKRRGENVWIDIEQMQGDIYDRMAEAVQKSDVVICCISEDYTQSQSCTREAKYADFLKKKVVWAKMQAGFNPKGWLGFISSYHYYYNFYDEERFDEQFNKMMKYIKSE